MRKQKRMMLLIGIIIGLVVGTVIGIINHNVPTWMLLGIAVGFGTSFTLEFLSEEEQ